MGGGVGAENDGGLGDLEAGELGGVKDSALERNRGGADLGEAESRKR